MATRIWVVRAAEVIAGRTAKGITKTATAPASVDGGLAGLGGGATGGAPEPS